MGSGQPPADEWNASLESARSAIASARAAPLSRKKAMLAILLLDAAVDAVFAASGEGDRLAFRARLAAADAFLSLVMAVAAMADGGPRLVVEPVTVSAKNYPQLAVEDYMVSLYNERTVQRVLVALPDGARRDVHDLLASGLNALEGRPW